MGCRATIWATAAPSIDTIWAVTLVLVDLEPWDLVVSCQMGRQETEMAISGPEISWFPPKTDQKRPKLPIIDTFW